MKRYYIRVPRDYQFSTCVEAEDSREAEFEAVKSLAFKALHGFIPLDITEGDEVYPCDQCSLFFPQSDLAEVGEKLLCAQCESYEHGDVPETW